MTISLLLMAIACAALDSLSPSVVGVVVYLLLVAQGPVGSRIAVYLSTVAGLYFLLGVALMAGLGPLLEGLGDVVDSRPFYWGQFILGVGLFLLSFWIGSKRRRERPRRARRIPTGTAAMVGLGLATIVLEAGLALPYFATIGLMVTSGVSTIEGLLVLALYVVIMISPALAIVALDAVLGARIRPRLVRLRDWIERNSAETISWIVGIVGFVLAWNAAGVLFSTEQIRISWELSGR